MDQYCEKIQNYLKEIDDIEFFINFYLKNVKHEPEKALKRAMEECYENMITELMYNYSESLNYKCSKLYDIQKEILEYLKKNPINNTPKEKKICKQKSNPIPIPKKNKINQWQNEISCSP